MRKAFLTGRALPLLLALFLVNHQARAGYSDDPDCKVVSDTAKAAGNRALERIDSVASETGVAIKKSKSCVDDVLSQANRAVADFGGGALADFATQLLAKQACQMLSSAQSQLPSSVSRTFSIVTADDFSAAKLPEAARAAGVQTPPVATSIWRRLANLF